MEAQVFAFTRVFYVRYAATGILILNSNTCMYEYIMCISKVCDYVRVLSESTVFIIDVRFFQVNRPLTMRKDGIQTRKRRPKTTKMPMITIKPEQGSYSLQHIIVFIIACRELWGTPVIQLLEAWICQKLLDKT